MSDNWKNQPRVPAGNPEGGQWTSQYSKAELSEYAEATTDEGLAWAIENDDDLDEQARMYLKMTLQMRKKAEAAARSAAGLTKDEAKRAATEVRRQFEKSIREESERLANAGIFIGTRDPQVKIEGYGKDGFAVMIRGFGSWENPPGSEDEQDYDWQIPTRETENRINRLVEQIDPKYPNFTVDWTVEEKRWITVFISPRQ